MHIAIIGNGIAGVTAARTIRKLDSEARITVISAESEHFFSRTALMYIYMGHMTFDDTKPYEDWFWAKNRIDLVHGFVHEIDTDARSLQLSNGQAIGYDKLLLSTGSRWNVAGWPGTDLPGVQGMVSLNDLHQMEANTRDVERAVVVGGGLIGVEMAEMLHSRGIRVTFLVREPTYMPHILPWEESQLVNREIAENGIDLRLSTELDRIEAGEDGGVRAVVTTDGVEIPCQFVGLTIGVSPNIDVVKRSNVETARGILVDRYLETNVPGVYAAGDCAEFRQPLPGRRRVEQLWYTGRIQGETVGKTLAGYRTEYEPGVFFNSAKFFDLEYQTYGHIIPQLPDDQDTLYWQHPQRKHAIRINYREDTGQVVALNLMGVRYRQDVCARWIREGALLDDVVRELGAANFDPEFSRQYEHAVVAAYNSDFPDRRVILRKKRGLSASIAS